MSLLLVEDNPVNQQVAAELLAGCGAHVEVAGSGADAIALTRLFDFHCVLMDLHMPDMDGFEATRAIRAEPRNADLPVIALTADASQAERVRSREAGMVGYMTKPFVLDDLAVLIVEAVTGAPAEDGVAAQAGGPAGGAPPDLPAIVAIDFDTLARFVPGDRHDHLRYARMFLELADRRLGEADVALRASQTGLAVVASIAHQLKSSARMMGVSGFVARCEQLEKTGDVGEAAALIVALRGMLPALSLSIERMAGDYQI